MKIVPFSDIFRIKFAITDISVIYQTNNWSLCDNSDGRKMNGFLIIDEGECLYRWRSDEARLHKGAMIYLPKGSQHTVRAPEHSLNFYRINFTLTDLSDGEEIVFSDTPSLITESVTRSIFNLCEDMRRATLSESGTFKRISLLSELMDFVRHTRKRGGGRVAAAIEYVESHYAEDVDVGALAKMCYMSEAHLFRLFKIETGMSPVEYKNALRIRKAEELLLDRECGISEIAAMLGFENACYFSRIFKRTTGLSPLDFRRSNT